jgi:hypothetical protein
MFKKIIRSTKRYSNFLCLGILVYIATILCLTAFYVDQYNQPTTYDLTNRLFGGPGGTDTWNNSTTLDAGIFDAQVIVMSDVERSSDFPRHFFALPGQQADIFRDFSIFMFTNQPTHYLVKVDNFTIDQGMMNWMKRIDRHSEYNTVSIYVLLENESGGSREFIFDRLNLMDSPSQGGTGGGGGDGSGTDNQQIPDFIKPYVQMSQGEFNLFVGKRVFADIISVIAGIIVGIQFAALKADFRGIERAL